MKDILDRIDGVVIGTLAALEDGIPSVALPGSAGAVPARSLVRLDAAAVGAEVALLFEAGDPARPLILGRVLDPGTAPTVLRDGERVRVTASERIELRVGKASLIMEKDGRITIRGSYVTSHASATNRIRGGSVNLN
jgi:Domain of unknown function (DUF6484)